MDDIAALLEEHPELELSLEDAADRLVKERARAARTESDRKLKGGLYRVACLGEDATKKKKAKAEFEAAECDEKVAAEELETAEALYKHAQQRRASALEAERQKNRDENFLELMEAVQAFDEQLFNVIADGLRRVEAAKNSVLKFTARDEVRGTRGIFERLDLRFTRALATHCYEFPQFVAIRHLTLDWNDQQTWGTILRKKGASPVAGNTDEAESVPRPPAA